MKKTVLLLMLALVILTAGFATGCANEAPDANVNQENTAAEQNNTLSIEAIDEYLESVKAQSDAINTSFENDPLTQTELNLKAMELSELWDGAMNYLLDELKNRMSEDEFSKLQDDQLAWIAERDKAVAEVGAEFEGGSFYSFVVSTEAASITEKRVNELYEMLK